MDEHHTGLTWQRSPDANGDGVLNPYDKLTWAQAQARPAALNAAKFGGHDDWRLPTIKELYSLIEHRLRPRNRARVYQVVWSQLRRWPH